MPRNSVTRAARNFLRIGKAFPTGVWSKAKGPWLLTMQRRQSPQVQSGLACYSREQELGFYGRQLVSRFHSREGCAPFLCAHIEGQDLPAGGLDKRDRIVGDVGPHHGPGGYVISRDESGRHLVGS